MSVRASWRLPALVVSMLVSGCGSPGQGAADSGAPSTARSAASTDAQADVAPTPGLALSGQPVRGGEVSAVIDGLQRFEGEEVALTLMPAESAGTPPGGSRSIYALVADSVVDDSGQATATFTVPNTLSGEDDIIPIYPGGDYVLSIAPQDAQEAPILVRFPIAAAEPGTAYPVEVAQGSGECGFPLTWIELDGENWLPEGATDVKGSGAPMIGVFTILTGDTARFDSASGATTTYLRADTGWAC